MSYWNTERSLCAEVTYKKLLGQLFLMGGEWEVKRFQGRSREFTRQMKGNSAKALRRDITPNAHKMANTAIPYLHWGIISCKSTDIGKVRLSNPSKLGTEGKTISWHYYISFQTPPQIRHTEDTSFKKNQY